MARNPIYGELEQRVKELEKAEEELRESEEKYRNLVDLLPIAMFQTDDKGILIYANKAFFEIYEYTEDILEKEFNSLQTLVPEDRYRAINTLSKVLDGENFGGTEYTAITKNGVKFPIIVHASRVSFKNKTIQHGVVIDYTKRKQAEETLRKAHDELNQQIEERKKTEDRLKTMVNAMAGRELRMAELKEVIKELRAQLKEAGMTPVADDPLKWREE